MNVKDETEEKIIKKPESRTGKEEQENPSLEVAYTGLPAESRSRIVSQCTAGLLNHYEPTFKNIHKDLGIKPICSVGNLFFCL